MVETQQAGATAGDLTPELIDTDIWTDEMVTRAGIPVIDVPLVSIGGGMGSFILADMMRIGGMPASDMKVLTVLDVPWQTYEYLTQVSQIPRSERLRSDSQSMPDNMWGFPSFAFREAWTDKTLDPVYNVVTEPILRDYYTPKAGQVFETMEREAQRIGYSSMVAKGQVRMSRRRAGGGYYTILTPPPGSTPTRRVAYRSRFVYICVGYPGVKFLDDLQDFRTRHPDMSTRVVNAYEPHEQVYEQLARRPGLVLIRGAGIVASRALQRLIDDRDAQGLQTQILHLFRSYKDAPYGSSIFSRRKAANGWTYQGFNWPKACWGGTLKYKLEKLEGEARAAQYKEWASTNTPNRKDWKQQLARGRQEGWYRIFQGSVKSVEPGPEGRIVTHIDGPQGTYEVAADFIVDATGLEADIREHRYMADLLDHSGAGRNPMGRLDVERTFEVRGTANPPGTMYAAGTMTLGGYFAGVDTFLGLQYSNLQIMDDLASRGFGQRMGPGRSFAQWWRWARHKPLEN